MRPVRLSDVRMEKATGDPIVKSERMTVIVKVKTMALTGLFQVSKAYGPAARTRPYTSQPGRILAKKPLKGMPPSLANDLVQHQSGARGRLNE